MNRFITFEGIEGSGKSTQVTLASEFLSARGVEHVRTREPGGTYLGDAVRRILLDPAQVGMSPMAELLLVCAARAQHVQEVVRPALSEGKVVLCDRFEDSSRAYQGHGRGISDRVIAALSSLTPQAAQPALTFLFDLPVEEGLQRARARNALPDGPEVVPGEQRIDDEEAAFHCRVRDGYLELARQEPARFRVLNAAESPEQLSERVAMHLSHHLQLAEGKSS